jgi:hypothetical protein
LAGYCKNCGRMSQELWPDIARIVAGCDKNPGRMPQDYWPDAAGILTRGQNSQMMKMTVKRIIRRLKYGTSFLG